MEPAKRVVKQLKRFSQRQQTAWAWRVLTACGEKIMGRKVALSLSNPGPRINQSSPGPQPSEPPAPLQRETSAARSLTLRQSSNCTRMGI